MRVFLDANILFLAALPHSRLRIFLEVLRQHSKLLTNHYAAEEARRNLAIKFPGSIQELESLVGECELIPMVQSNLPVKLAAKDLPILGGAIAGQAEYLLTGDGRDFGPFYGQTILGVKVVAPGQMVEELRNLGLI